MKFIIFSAISAIFSVPVAAYSITTPISKSEAPIEPITRYLNPASAASLSLWKPTSPNAEIEVTSNATNILKRSPVMIIQVMPVTRRVNKIWNFSAGSSFI